MFPLARLPWKHKESRALGQVDWLVLAPLQFDMAAQAALGTFQSIFKLTIYNYFLKKTNKEWGSQAKPYIAMEGSKIGVGGQ